MDANMFELRQGQWRLELSAEGRVLSLTDGTLEWAEDPCREPLAVRDTHSTWTAERPDEVATSSERIEFAFRTSNPVDAAISVAFGLLPLSDGGVALERQVRIQAPRLKFPIELVLPHACVGPADGCEHTVPRSDGTAYRGDSNSFFLGTWYYEVAGPTPKLFGGRLGIPLIESFWPDLGWGIGYCGDPQSSLRLGYPEEYFSDGISWGLDGQAGDPLDHTHRVYCCIHRNGLEGALGSFYESALADVPPAPAWVRDVALVSCDYMSRGGSGWFDDVDALAAELDRGERSRVLLCQHGWYDYVGRYSFDSEKRRLDSEWMALSNAEAVHGSPVFPGLKSVLMSPEKVRHRLAYARDQGFRVALYFAAGVIADESTGGLYTPDATIARGLWQGPDTQAATWAMTPAHPRVREWFLSYTEALLAEFGDAADAFMWDYTLFPQAEHDAWSKVPGYGPEAMMRLTKEIAGKCHAHRPDLAFFASDLISAWRNVTVPYAIMTDGVWQDSFCEPDFWGSMIWPNARNVAWSHNFAPRRNWKHMKFGVENFQAPIALGRGFVDDEGFADFDIEFRDQLLALFRKRAAQPTALKPLDQELLARLRSEWDGSDW